MCTQIKVLCIDNSVFDTNDEVVEALNIILRKEKVYLRKLIIHSSILMWTRFLVLTRTLAGFQDDDDGVVPAAINQELN